MKELPEVEKIVLLECHHHYRVAVQVKKNEIFSVYGIVPTQGIEGRNALDGGNPDAPFRKRRLHE